MDANMVVMYMSPILLCIPNEMLQNIPAMQKTINANIATHLFVCFCINTSFFFYKKTNTEECKSCKDEISGIINRYIVFCYYFVVFPQAQSRNKKYRSDKKEKPV